MFRRRRERSPVAGLARRAEGQGQSPAGERQEQRILSALADLRDTEVREVMTPRVDVVGLSIPVAASDVARAVRESGHQCFPVYDDDLDNLVGVLYVNDLFRAGWVLDAPHSSLHHRRHQGATEGPDQTSATAPAAATVSAPLDRPPPSPLDISRRLRQPYLVPESRLVLDVLADMRHDQRAFAVVVDEYGGVAGVVTVKDVLAALVGDLHDEFDVGGEPEVIRVDRTRWLVDGGTSVDEVRSRLSVDLPDGEYVTLGGYLFDAFGHIPEEGERLVHGDWEFRVVEMDRRRVAKVVAQGPATGGAG